MNSIEKKIEDHLRIFEDFPNKGIKFFDISVILKTPDIYNSIIDLFAEFAKKLDFDVITSPDARGFLLGPALALKLNKPFVMVRKKNKLPGITIQQCYGLEYGSSIIEIQEDAFAGFKKALIVDDIVATGGTSFAIQQLLERQNIEIVGQCFIISLEKLLNMDNISGSFYPILRK